MGKKTLDRKVIKIILGDALPYELNQLEQSYILLMKPPRDDVIRSALIGSFCIHARLLINFFEDKDDLKASQFTGSKYVAQHVVAVSSGLRKKLNQQIAHLNAQRTDDPAKKIGDAERTALLCLILPEAVRFRSQLPTADRALLDAKYTPRIMMAGQPQPSATGHPTFISTKKSK